MGSGANPEVLDPGSFDGILDGDPRANPTFFLWNHISATYCSSDSFLGDIAAGELQPHWAGGWAMLSA